VLGVVAIAASSGFTIETAMTSSAEFMARTRNANSKAASTGIYVRYSCEGEQMRRLAYEWIRDASRCCSKLYVSLARKFFKIPSTEELMRI
jgi:hypothetical protein